MLPRKALIATLLSLGALVALLIIVAAPASAVPSNEYVVNTTNDEAGTTHNAHECKTEQDHCSLRAAIELVNEEEEAANTISFDPSVFDGEEGDAVRVQTTSLPSIEFPTTIEAGTGCTTATIVGAPCAGVTGLNGEPVFVVDADDTTIKGLSIAEGSVGIEVNESTGFKATGDWIGIEMSGSNALPASADGILLGHGSDEAVIGGSGAGERNVIAFNQIGLDIFGASHATVQGNWFGMAANGVDPGPQEIDIKITNYKPLLEPEVEAESNEIGALLDSNAQTSDACDGGCNVISGAENGIELNGNGALNQQAPASGPTRIRGNYIGLDPTGAEAVKVALPVYEGNRFDGIRAGAAGQVTVGGAPESEANYFAGGLVGLASEDADEFEAKGNFFGESPSGAPVTPMQGAAVDVVATPGTEEPVIAENQIRMGESGRAISETGGGSMIIENVISGGEEGIFSESNTAGAGSQIEGNVVEDVEGVGIFVSNAENDIRGNEVLRASDTGIEVSSGGTESDGNVVGGDPPEAENVISGGGGFALVIAGSEGTRNEIRANHGSGNEGELGFIVLRDVPNEAPNGVEEPTVETAGRTEAAGTAEPHAIVRVFDKASAEPGELGGYLGKAEADGSGNWKVTYNTPVSGETRITATQTLDGGTSMLAEPVKTPHDSPPPPVCPEPGAIGCESTTPPSSTTPTSPGSSATSPPPPASQPVPDTASPNTMIKAAPKANSTSTTAKFKFVSSEPGSTFQCRLDGKPFKSCRSPKTYKKLKPGKHVFEVRAIDRAGNVDPTPAKRKFTVLG